MANDSSDEQEEGVWEPVSRVGSAGGILGGSVGSSLLGFVDVTFSPTGHVIVGHGYGGSLHFWTTTTRATTTASDSTSSAAVTNSAYNDEHVWNANPGITGHFRGVMDLDWEVTSGQYLLSVGLDQTCRLWHPLPNTTIWMELGRPQVHGYD